MTIRATTAPNLWLTGVITWLGFAALCVLTSCGDEPQPGTEGVSPRPVQAVPFLAASSSVEPEQPVDEAAEAREDAALAAMMAPMKGDLDALAERRYIRVLVALSRSLYYIDKGEQFGMSYDAGKLFEEALNEQLGSGVIQVRLEFLPVRRERIFEMLAEGRGDLAMANLTVTDERAKLADFASPFITGVNEIVVTAKDEPPVKSVDDLAGREMHVRKSSTYHTSLVALNETLTSAGKKPVVIVVAPEDLEDEDILEMVDGGLIPATIVDAHVAKIWQDVYTDLRIHEDVHVRENGSIAWAVRKDCPKLLAAVNTFAKENKKGSLHFNMLYKKYLKGGKKLERSADSAEAKKFQALIETFKKHGDTYDLPWLLLAALGYQESRLDQKARSASGAVGVMQLLPSTAAGPPVEIKNVETSIDANVEASAKYLRWIADNFVNEPELDKLTKSLFVLASYNAGPTRIAKLRKKAAAMGLDPNRWFGNVEVVVAKEIGRETIQYVSNIYKYYVSYALIVERAHEKSETEKR